MPALKAASQGFKLVMDKQTLKSLFVRVEHPADRHRIAERLSKINQLARPFGVSLTLEREDCRVSVQSPSQEAIRDLARVLREKGGSVRGVLGNWLVEHFNQAAEQGCPFSKIRENQLSHLRGRLARDWGAFSTFNPDEILVELGAERSKSRLLEHAIGLLSSASRGGLVLGDVGAGKTTLLYQVLKSYPRSGERLAGLIPVYVPSTRLFFKWGEGVVAWGSLPGVESHMTPALQAAFKEGRLLLLIDGINENPNCVDFTNPGVQHFWECALKNAFLVSTHPKHYESCLKLSPLDAFCKLPRLSLPQWQLKDYQTQFANIIKVAERSSDPFLAPRLKRFPLDKWVEQASLLRRTPLVGCAAANFVAHSPEARLPRNEYELLDHMVLCHLNRRAFQGNVAQREALMGVLMKIAVQAYQEGQSGDRWCVPTQKALEMARGHYGISGSENFDMRVALANLPFVDFSPASDLLFLDQHVGDFLVARFLLNALLARDYARFREILVFGIRYDRVGKYYFQGFECPSREVQLRLLRHSEELFKHLWETFAKTQEFPLSLVLGQLLQPLGHLAIPEARQFLWEAFHQTQGPNFVFLSATIALARGGEEKAEETFIQWLSKNPGRRDFILQWRLFYERNDKSRRDFESFVPGSVPVWEDACDWLLRALTEGNSHFYPLRHLYVFTMLEFIKAKGMAPFHPPAYGNGSGLHKAMERRRLLKQAVTVLDGDIARRRQPLFQAHLKALKAHAAKLLNGQNGGSDEQKVKDGQKGKSVTSVREEAPSPT